MARRNTRAGLSNPGINPRLWQMIVRGSRQFGLDPYAAAAVSRVEGGGRFGAVGDQGTSFGPFQLHRGGALPAGRGAQWANSQAGVLYALRKMAESGARGKTGLAAIHQIVRRFERPADPDAEVKKAWGLYQDMGAPPQSAAYLARAVGYERSYRGGLQPPGSNTSQSLLGLVGKVGPLSQRAADYRTSLLDQQIPNAQTPGRPSRGQGGVPGGAIAAGGGWAGSEGMVMSLTKGIGLSVTSSKRDRQNTQSGGVSDHWSGNKTAFAHDLGGSVAEMDKAAMKLAKRLGIQYKKGQPLVATVNRNGYRIQVLYRTMTGGDHFDHIHVGVRRIK